MNPEGARKEVVTSRNSWSSGPKLALLLTLFVVFSVTAFFSWLKHRNPAVAPFTPSGEIDRESIPSSSPLQALRGYEFQEGSVGETLFRFLEKGAPDYRNAVMVFKNKDFASDTLTGMPPLKQKELEDLARVLISFPGLQVEIAGHSDESRDVLLSFSRSGLEAETVRQVLIREGVDSSQIQTRGYGFRFPVTDNIGPEARAQNRRVELSILELPSLK